MAELCRSALALPNPGLHQESLLEKTQQICLECPGSRGLGTPVGTSVGESFYERVPWQTECLFSPWTISLNPICYLAQLRASGGGSPS